MSEHEAGRGYATPRALEMAVKSAAERSPMDTGRAMSAFWFHRPLCRAFADGNDRFVLKGGRAMLARTTDARATRDIDLLARGNDLGEATEELKALAAADLGDQVRFAFSAADPIKTDDEYRSGAKLVFDMWLGSKRMQPVSIDLVVDEVPLERAERVCPADRIVVRGIEGCDYLVYPVEAALADKFCGIVERHQGRPSSRVKDLVDVAVYATTCDADGAKLRARLLRELGARGIPVPDGLCIPGEWGQTAYSKAYSKQAAGTGLPERLHDVREVADLGKTLFNPILDGEGAERRWACDELFWPLTLLLEAFKLRALAPIALPAKRLQIVRPSQAPFRHGDYVIHFKKQMRLFNRICPALLAYVSISLEDAPAESRGHERALSGDAL
jgi:hypothetical protein